MWVIHLKFRHLVCQKYLNAISIFENVFGKIFWHKLDLLEEKKLKTEVKYIYTAIFGKI